MRSRRAVALTIFPSGPSAKISSISATNAPDRNLRSFLVHPTGRLRCSVGGRPVVIVKIAAAVACNSPLKVRDDWLPTRFGHTQFPQSITLSRAKCDVPGSGSVIHQRWFSLFGPMSLWRNPNSCATSRSDARACHSCRMSPSSMVPASAASWSQLMYGAPMCSMTMNGMPWSVPSAMCRGAMRDGSVPLARRRLSASRSASISARA